MPYDDDLQDYLDDDYIEKEQARYDREQAHMKRVRDELLNTPSKSSQVHNIEYVTTHGKNKRLSIYTNDKGEVEEIFERDELLDIF